MPPKPQGIYGLSNSRKLYLLVGAVVVLVPLLLFKRCGLPFSSRSNSSAAPESKMASLDLQAEEIPPELLKEQKNVEIQQKQKEVKVKA